MRAFRAHRPVNSYHYQGDCRLPHESADKLPTSALADVGVLYYSFPLDKSDSEDGVAKLAKERNYKNKDVITVAPSAMGDVYEQKIEMFFREHMHEDEEIRYILEGKGYFDVRNPGDRWIRIELESGDLIVLPAGIYHRFTVNTDNVSYAFLRETGRAVTDCCSVHQSNSPVSRRAQVGGASPQQRDRCQSPSQCVRGG